MVGDSIGERIQVNLFESKLSAVSATYDSSIIISANRWNDSFYRIRIRFPVCCASAIKTE